MPVPIVPCGLTFIHPKRFRSRVLVQYGAPIVAAGDARELTTAIGKGLERLTINAPDWDTVRALDVVRRLYQPHEISIEERVELARRFNAYYGQVAAEPRVVELMHEVRAYQRKLDELEISDRKLARDLSKLEVVMRVVRQLVLIGFVLPLTMPGALLHVPPLVFARYASPRLTPRKDVVGTTKLLLGMLLVLLGYALAIRPLSAVTHSMGGVIVRHLHDPRLRWERIVMLAPPNQGSRLAAGLVRNPVFRWFYGPAGAELADATSWPAPPAPCAVIAGTRSLAWTNPTSWTVGRRFPAGVPNDGTVAVDETKLPGMAAFAEVDATHTWIMNASRVHRLVVEYLREGAFQA